MQNVDLNRMVIILLTIHRGTRCLYSRTANDGQATLPLLITPVAKRTYEWAYKFELAPTQVVLVSWPKAKSMPDDTGESATC